MFRSHTLYHNWLVGLGIIWGAAALARGEPEARPGPQTQDRAAPQAQPAVAGAPRMEFSPTECNFGEVWQTQPATVEFTIKNTGGAPLTISAKSSCGCTVATRPKSPLAPGESCAFAITYDSKHAGKARKKVTLTTNDPERPKVEIPVVGVVKQLYEGIPSERIWFQDLDEDSVVTASITLVNKYDQPWELKLKEGQDTGPYKVELQELTPGQKYELIATTKPPLKPGRNNKLITLETGVPAVPAFDIFIIARIPPRVEVQPTQLTVNPNKKRPYHQILRVKYRAAEPIQITAVKTTPAGMDVQIIPGPSSAPMVRIARHQVRVELPAYDDLPDRGAKVEIFTDDPGEFHKLTVPIVKRIFPGARRAVARGPTSQPARAPDRDALRERIEQALRQRSSQQPAETDEDGAEVLEAEELDAE